MRGQQENVPPQALEWLTPIGCGSAAAMPPGLRKGYAFQASGFTLTRSSRGCALWGSLSPGPGQPILPQSIRSAAEAQSRQWEIEFPLFGKASLSASQAAKPRQGRRPGFRYASSLKAPLSSDFFLAPTFIESLWGVGKYGQFLHELSFLAGLLRRPAV